MWKNEIRGADLRAVLLDKNYKVGALRKDKYVSFSNQLLGSQNVSHHVQVWLAGMGIYSQYRQMVQQSINDGLVFAGGLTTGGDFETLIA